MTEKNPQSAQDLKSKIEAAKEKMSKRGVATPDLDVKAVRTKANDEKKKERDEKRKALEAERAEKKTAREQKKAAKMAALAARKPHFKKLENARAKLPKISAKDAELIAGLVCNHSEAELVAIAENLRFQARVALTERALAANAGLKVGDKVTIVNGDPRHVGATGTLTTLNKIRCYVTLEDSTSDKPVYLFVSDVAPKN